MIKSQKIACTFPFARVQARFLMLVLCLVVGGFLRFYGMGARSLWWDETLSWRLIQFPIGEMCARTGEAKTVHPPLYFLVLKAWSALWGDSEIALRSLAGVLGLVTIYIVFKFICEVWQLEPPSRGDVSLPSRGAWVAAACVALNPFQVHLSQQARNYTMALAFFAGSSWMLFRALRPQSKARDWWFYGGLALALCYTHHLALFTVLAQGLFIAWELWGVPPGDDLGGLSRNRRRALIVVASMVLGYLPWLPHLLGQSENGRNAWRGLRQIEDVPRQITQALLGTFNSSEPPTAMMAWSVTAAILALTIWQAATGGRIGRYLAWTGLVPTALILGMTYFSKRSLVYSRYFALTQLAWILAFALGAARIPLTAERRIVTALFIGGSSLLCLLNWRAIGPESEPGMRGAVEYVLQRRGPDEPFYVRTPSAYFGALYYSRGRILPLLTVPEAGRLRYRGSAQLRDEDLISVGKVLTLKASGVWVLSTDSYDTNAVVRFPIPERWAFQGNEMFDQDYIMEQPLEVEHYQIEKASHTEPLLLRP